MEDKRPLQSIPDDELLHRLAKLMGQSRRVEADIVAHIAEVEERGLYAREAFPSMFSYCMNVLHLSEAEAYLRILAARATRKHPLLLTMLADGRLHLTAIVKLAPHLTLANRDVLLERATHRSKRQILDLVAEIAPRPDVPAEVRKLPERTIAVASPLVVPGHRDRPMPGLCPDLMLGVGQEPALEHRPDAVAAPESGVRRDEAPVFENVLPTQAPAVGREASALPVSLAASAPMLSRPGVADQAAPHVLEPLSPGRYKVQFTASSQFHDKLERLQALMRSKVPNGDLAAVIEQAVTEKLERLEARRYARTKPPRKDLAKTRTETATNLDASPSSRHIPAPIRRAVYERDGGRCRYVDEQGRRCPEQNRLEFHHRHPFGRGGDHSVANVGLICHAHNAYLAECDYGRKAMASHRRRSRAPEPVTG
jgi:hypothetical protein